MPEKTEKVSPRRPSFGYLALLLAGLIFLYLGSMGPSYYLPRNGHLRQRTFTAMYAPAEVVVGA